MDRALAKVVAVAAFRSSTELNSLLPVLREYCEDDEYTRFRDAIADIALATSQRLLQQVFSAHPDLESEIEENFKSFGRPA